MKASRQLSKADMVLALCTWKWMGTLSETTRKHSSVLIANVKAHMYGKRKSKEGFSKKKTTLCEENLVFSSEAEFFR